MDALLKFKHWQIFMLTCGILIIVLVLQLIIIFSSEPIITFPGSDVLFERIVMLVGVATSVANACYLYIVGTKLAEKRPKYDGFNEGSFKTALYAIVAISALRAVILPLAGLETRGMDMLLGIVSLVANLYADYFVAKALKSVEMDRKSTFDDFTGDFFSFVFLPIGVWWLQPRINAIFDKESTSVDPDAPLDQHVSM